MAEHQLKTWTPYFEEVRSGRKPFELRKDDRGFAVGDILELREFEPGLGYTGRACRKVVTYVFGRPEADDAAAFGLTGGYAILALADPPEVTPATANDAPADANAVRASESPTSVGLAIRAAIVRSDERREASRFRLRVKLMTRFGDGALGGFEDALAIVATIPARNYNELALLLEKGVRLVPWSELDATAPRLVQLVDEAAGEIEEAFSALRASRAQSDPEFQGWLDDLSDLAAAEGALGYVESTGVEAWRTTFEDGVTPAEAWATEKSYAGEDHDAGAVSHG